jgi:lipopolysaccharide transport system ATP-binding protein
MAGLLMGLSSVEIDNLMPQIEGFAEIGADFDRPMRTYSTGMLARVAFSVATARRCDVILVDEALSVGDAYFQQKSFARLREYKAAGSTLVLVSHDKAAVQSICDSVMLLDGGRLVARDAPAPMFDLYNALIAGESAASVERSLSADGATRLRSGSGEARVTGVNLCDAQSGAPIAVCEVGQRVILKIEVAVERRIERLVLGFSIRDRLGNVVFGTNTHHTSQALKSLDAGRRLQFATHMPLNIGAGRYSISTALVDGATHLGENYEWVDHAHEFDVVMGSAAAFEGAAWLEPRIEVTG